jgi:outer membrane receptor protein involved in Fe transport
MFGKKKRSPVALVTGVSIAAIGAAAPGVAAAQEQARVSDEIVVTAQKREEALQDVPIAVSAFNQSSLEALQIDGGPNLVTAIPNMNFSKGNFTGYNFQIRGIGTKAVGVSVDGSTGIHQNGAPIGANNLYEAEFYDVERVEVLRGPQGTLYGRNATGGVLNIITEKARPGEWEGYAQVTGANYGSTRFEGMINVPIGDSIALRVAGTQLKRDGYATNEITGNEIDDRDLWGVRTSLGIDLSQEASLNLLYEHFEEDDARNRNGKQLCIKDPGDTSIGGVATNAITRNFLSQGCADGNALNSRTAVNTAATLGGLLGNLSGLITGDAAATNVVPQDLRTVQSAFDPVYRASTDYYQAAFSWDVTDSVTLSVIGGYTDYTNKSSEDYNKFRVNNTFNNIPVAPFNVLFPGGVVTDPQVGASNRFNTQDLSTADATATSVEVRLQSDFDGPLNFNVGGIQINGDSNARYYVFGNTLTAFAQLQNAIAGFPVIPIDTSNPNGATIIDRVNDSGRNYFLSNSDYNLDAYAVFGELYYDVSDTFKLTLGLRQTSDEKRQSNRFTTLLTPVAGPGSLPLAATAPTNAFFNDPVNPYLFASFEEITGRAGFDWKPDLSFTDETLFYAFYSRGYKGGGINPPAAVGVASIQPTFDPEFVNSIEIGTKNTLADGRLQLNLTGFSYNYEGYQVSKIVNRTSLNENIDASIYGIELESRWSPIDPLTFILNAGYLHTEIDSGRSIDNLNRTQNNPLFTVIKASNASNCVGAVRGIAAVQAAINAGALPTSASDPTGSNNMLGYCSGAFANAGTAAAFNGILQAVSPGAALTVADLTPIEGFEANLAGNALPNSPEYTVSIGAQWVQPIGGAWDIVFRGDYYHQAESYARVYNTAADVLPSWDNANFSIALNNNEKDFEIKAFVKNAFDDDSVTDMYLTDDSSGLFRNYFLVEPQVYGVTVQKRW